MLIYTIPVMSAPLTISGAWIKNLPAVVPVRAGYMTITNTAEQNISITGIESELFTAVELHETVENDGMMSMQQLTGLTIAAGTSRELKPGGIHLMMMRPRQTLKLGDLVTVRLLLDNGDTQTLQMIVKK
ncbi:MAG: copper chaperone PCu(A)C [Gammaproteobacteria bacterium]|nr:copper chaperone PCu(A)C [Gammaproteobacteria bacterium]